MPYHIEKADGGYYVVGPSGRKSSKPLSHDRATRQMRALYANEPGLKEGGKVATPYLNPNKPSHRAILQKQATVPEGTDLPMQASKAPRGARANLSGKQKKQKTAGNNNMDRSMLKKTAAPNPADMGGMGGMPPVMALPQAGAAPGFLKGGKLPFERSGNGAKAGSPPNEKDAPGQALPKRGAGKTGGKDHEKSYRDPGKAGGPPLPHSTAMVQGITPRRSASGAYGETMPKGASEGAAPHSGLDKPQGKGGAGPIQRTGSGAMPKRQGVRIVKPPYGFKTGGKYAFEHGGDAEESGESVEEERKEGGTDVRKDKKSKGADAGRSEGRVPGYKNGGKNFIAGAIKKPGQLHRDLGVPQGEKIPESKIKSAASKGGKVGARARFAEVLKGIRSGK